MLALVVLVARDLDARPDERHTEHEQQPPELLDEGGAGELTLAFTRELPTQSHLPEAPP